MLTPQKDLPTNLEVQVNKGEGRLIEIMVSSFYDKRILNTVGVTDLLGLLEFGMTNVKARCATFLANFFSPIEEKT